MFEAGDVHCQFSGSPKSKNLNKRDVPSNLKTVWERDSPTLIKIIGTLQKSNIDTKKLPLFEGSYLFQSPSFWGPPAVSFRKYRWTNIQILVFSFPKPPAACREKLLLPTRCCSPCPCCIKASSWRQRGLQIYFDSANEISILNHHLSQFPQFPRWLVAEIAASKVDDFFSSSILSKRLYIPCKHH